MQNENQTPDVAIIGAGVIGMSIAWHLSQRGVKVLVVDRVGVGAGMTAIQPGGVRTQFGQNDTFVLAKESQEFYQNFVERTGAVKDPELVPCGYAFVATKPETLAALEASVKSQNEQGIASRMLSLDELEEMVPGIAIDQILGATFNESDGYLNSPGAPVSGFADGAFAAGAEIEIAAVEKIEPAGEGWQLSLSNGTQVTAPKLVVAAGVETAGLLDGLGANIPLTSEPRYLFYSNPINERLVEPLVIFQDEHFAVKHLADGSVLASDLSAGLNGKAADENAMRKDLTEKANRLVETLEYVKFPVMVTGKYDVTPDQQLILGSVENLSGVYVACGMNGRGMMLAPAVGRVIAESIISGNDDSVPTGMRLDRFKGGPVSNREQMVI